MIARLRNINKDVATVIAAVIVMAFLIWGIVFMVGNIANLHQDYAEKVATQKDEDAHEPMVIPEEEGVQDDGTGSYGQHIRPNGKLGTGYDMGGGVIMKPNGGIGFGIDLGL